MSYFEKNADTVLAGGDVIPLFASISIFTLAVILGRFLAYGDRAKTDAVRDEMVKRIRDEEY